MATQAANQACIFYVESSTIPRQIGGIVFYSRKIADQFADYIRTAGKQIGDYINMQIPDWDFDEQPVCILSPNIEASLSSQLFNSDRLAISTGGNMSHEEVLTEWSSEPDDETVYV